MPHLTAARPPSTPVGWTLAELAEADDAAVATMLGSDDVRQAVLDVALAATAPAGGWSGPHGVVRLDVVLPDGALWTSTVCFDSGGAAAAPQGEPDVALRIPLVPLARLVTGQADGALLYLAGVLEVDGREDLVLGLGTTIRTGPDRRPVVDAAALDPVAVSAAIDGVRLEHLAAVMSGGFRELVLSEVFRRLPEFVIAEKAAGVKVAIAFEVAGRQDGGIDRYVVRIADGACEVTTDTPGAEDVDATLELEGHEFLRLVLGHLNPVRGVLSGQVRVRGQVVKALGFNAVMRIPGS